MYLLYCDETNFEKKPGDFFVYGGIALDAAKSADIAGAIEALRKSHDVPRDYVLKFNPGPAEFSHQQFIALKQDLIAIGVKFECRLLVNLLLHDIAKSSEEARRFGINTLCYHFDCLLNRSRQPGLVLIDRFEDTQIDAQLRERLAVGLTGKLPYSSEMKINHIVGYHYSAVGQSHFCSLIDVVIGSLRFAINAFTRGGDAHTESARKILSLLSPLFFREKGNEVHEISLWFSPKEVRADKYRERYKALREFLAANGITSAQVV